MIFIQNLSFPMIKLKVQCCFACQIVLYFEVGLFFGGHFDGISTAVCQAAACSYCTAAHLQPTQSGNLGQGWEIFFWSQFQFQRPVFCLKQYLFIFCFRMRAKTNDFLKILNRAKIEDENMKKVSKFRKQSPKSYLIVSRNKKAAILLEHSVLINLTP